MTENGPVVLEDRLLRSWWAGKYPNEPYPGREQAVFWQAVERDNYVIQQMNLRRLQDD